MRHVLEFLHALGRQPADKRITQELLQVANRVHKPFVGWGQHSLVVKEMERGVLSIKAENGPLLRF